MRNSGSARRRTSRLLSVLLVAGAVVSACSAAAPQPARPPDREPPPALVVLNEVYEPGAASLQRNQQAGLDTSATFHPPLGAAELDLMASSDRPVAYFAIPPEADLSSCYPASADPDIRTTLRGLTPGGQLPWVLAAPEFDQSGGPCWADGRPSSAGLGDDEAYAAWMRYYLETRRLGDSLGQPAEQRGYTWMALCVYAFCPQYAFDMGSEIVLLERNTDELSGLVVGLPMIRGAAAQNPGRSWGVDMSTWRYWTDGPTEFDEAGRLVSGWSPSTFERHLYASYMGGSPIIHNEAAVYTDAAGELNPLGTVLRGFIEFTDRHPERGIPQVTMAVMQKHTSGFEPEFGEYLQVPFKWYADNPFTPGDTMLSNALATAFPGHASWGTIVDDAPWRVVGDDGTVDIDASRAAYRRALADGADPRRWEPMGSTRWGDSLDVVTDRASPEVLRGYPTVMLAFGTPPADATVETLEHYVRDGGTLVVNSTELSPPLATLAGVRSTGEARDSTGATWVDDGRTAPERSTHAVLEIDGARVLATSSGGDPVVTENRHGAGRVIVTAPDRLESPTGGMLMLGEQLMGRLQNEAAPATVDGPPVQYVVNRTGSGLTVTLMNVTTSGTPWTGTITFRGVSEPYTTTELITGSRVPAVARGVDVAAEITVPPYGVSVVSLESETPEPP